MIRLNFWQLIVALNGLVAGCALVPGSVPDIFEAEFEIHGRAALRYAGEGGSVRLTWRHAREMDDLLVTNPLGQGLARITRRGADVRLNTVDNKEFRAADAESLTESVLGWRLPLTGLPDWVRGRPVAGRPALTKQDEQGRLAELTQDQWRVEYLAWEGNLPSRLTLRFEGAGADPGRQGVEIRLIVDEWKVAP